ncbi:MAG: YciI family protein [Chloroflexota bacterium]
MKYYLLSMIQPDGDPPPPEVLDPIMREVAAINQELVAADAWVFGGGLHAAATSTVVRVRDGEELMTDGPFVEAKEHVGGISIIRAPDLDAALEWAMRFARATGLPIELRPFQRAALHSRGSD